MPSTDQRQTKPRLLVILGAGSSIPCGMPSVGDIDELMKRWSSGAESAPSVNSEGEVFNVLPDYPRSSSGSPTAGKAPPGL